MTTSLELTRSQILAFRRRVAALDERLPRGRSALRRAAWAGIGRTSADPAFAALGRSLVSVATPIGNAWISSRDEPLFRAAPGPTAPARLLPSGDTWFLLQGRDRELLVPDERERRALWTSRVWPGALLVDGDTVGTWRRSAHQLTVRPWRRLSRTQRHAVEAEAASLPLPGVGRPIEVLWDHDVSGAGGPA